MSLLQISILIKIIGTCGLSLVYVYLFFQYREKYVGLWALSWTLFGARVGLDLLRFNGYDATPLLFLNQALSIASVLLLVYGTYSFVGKKSSIGWLYSGLGVTILSDLGFIAHLSLPVCTFPSATFFGAADIWTGIMFLRFRKLNGLGKYVTGSGLILLGVLNANYTFLATNSGPYTVFAFQMGSFLELTIIIGTLIIYFQRIRKDLSDNEKKFRLLAENARDIIYRFALLPNLKCEFISQALTPITGYLPEELYANPGLAKGVLCPEDLTMLRQKIRADSDIANKPLVLQLRRKDETKVWVEMQNVTYYDRAGSLVAVEGIARDISERKSVEQEMLRLDRLRLLGETAASIAHEIRNPMTTVRGFLQLFQAKSDLQTYHEHFELMIEELDCANKIITDYLSLSKDKRLELRTNQLNEVIKALLPMIESRALACEQEIKLDLQTVPNLALDEREIRQMILNLAQNGLDAMPPGGVLSIRTWRDKEQVVLAVEDQGCGIAQGVMDKLGTPFFTTKEQGTGLGLSVCYNIAARHSATIKVSSGAAGTTFYVRFNLPLELQTA